MSDVLNDITIESLLSLCSYGTHINVKLSDNGKLAINGVSSLKNSKDKRQIAKWEAFKGALVYSIRPTVDMAWIKRHEDMVVLTIEAHIHRLEYDRAMVRYEAILRGEQHDD